MSKQVSERDNKMTWSNIQQLQNPKMKDLAHE